MLVEDAWSGSTAYAVDAVVEPATSNGYRYRATVGGTSSSSAPANLADHDWQYRDRWERYLEVRYQNRALAWDDDLAGLDSDLTSLTISAAAP